MKIAVLGCGNMGGALIEGIYKMYGDECELTLFDMSQEKLYLFSSYAKFDSPENWFQNDVPDAVILAVKPQVFEEALKVFKVTDEKTLWISVAAGLSIDDLSEMLPLKSKICRVMPNTPSLIQRGMSGFTLASNCGDRERELVKSILAAVGDSVEVPEYMMNAVTGLSGSGPAYVYMFIEALADGAVAAGLPYDIALKSAAQTVLGAAEMVLKTGEAPAVLRSKVMSAGGTTAAAVSSLEEKGFRGACISAVSASAKRAQELSKS